MERIVDTITGPLLEVHVTIDRALFAARMAAMAGDPVLEAWLGRLETVLRLHIRHEEELLLPIWARTDAPPNCTAAVLREEHDRILRLVDAVGAGDRFERLGQLAAVLEHHDAREAGAFKPGLDALLDPATRRRILARIEAELVLPAEPPLPSVTSRPAALPLDDGSVRGALALVRAALATDQAADLGLIEARLPDLPGATGRKPRRVLDQARQALAGDESDPVTRRLGRILAYDRLRLLDLLLEPPPTERPS